jgi:hypothetical protein
MWILCIDIADHISFSICPSVLPSLKIWKLMMFYIIEGTVRPVPREIYFE